MIWASALPVRTHTRIAIAAAALPSVAVGLLNGLYLEHLAATPLLYWCADLAQWVLIPAICLYALARFAAIGPRAYGLRGPDAELPAGSLAVATVLACAVFALAYFGTSALAERWLPQAPPHFSYAHLIPSGAMRVPVVIYFALSAGIVEEVVYRGLPLAALGAAIRERGVLPAYVLVSATLFSSIHWEGGLIGLIPAFVVGVVAALLYLRIGNLWPLVIAHAQVNLIHFW